MEAKSELVEKKASNVNKPRVAHAYFDSDITKAKATGKPIQALCGLMVKITGESIGSKDGETCVECFRLHMAGKF